jgi:hypothetical protein
MAAISSVKVRRASAFTHLFGGYTFLLALAQSPHAPGLH